MDILEIEGKDIFSLNKDEANSDISMYHALYKILNVDIKIVSMKFPVNTQYQKEYIKYKINSSTNSIQKEFLADKLYELELLEERRSNKEYYCFIFGKSPEVIKNMKETFIRTLYHCTRVNEIEENKKKLILKKLLNQNSKIESRSV